MASNTRLPVHDQNDIFNVVLSGTSGSCSFCGKKSEDKCDRCGDYYCSRLCQQKDWANHRFICFPMPKLVKAGQCLFANSVNKNDSQDNPAPKEAGSSNQISNGSCVFLTAFKSSNRCYVRSTNPSVAAEYSKFLKEIHEFGQKSSGLSEKPKINSYAIAQMDGKWCRVQILASFKGRFRVAYTDFGNTKIINAKELKKIAPTLANLPCLVHLINLKDITNVVMQDSLLKSLKQYVNKEYKIIFTQPDKSNGQAELYQWGTDILLNSVIDDFCNNFKKDSDKDANVSVASLSSNDGLEKNEQSQKKDSEMKFTRKLNGDKNSKVVINGGPTEKPSKAGKSAAEKNVPPKSVESQSGTENVSENKRKEITAPRQIKKPCLVPPFETILLNENDVNCKSLIMDNSYLEDGYIGCLLEKYCENFKLVSKFLKELDVDDQPYTPKFNEYCLAKFESEWYRAKVIEVLADDKFLVVYIDFANEMELTSKSIRRYPMSLTFPCCTSLCSIDGLPDDIPTEMKSFLESYLAPFQLLDIDSVRVEDGIRYIKCNELLKGLRASKLL